MGNIRFSFVIMFLTALSLIFTITTTAENTTGNNSFVTVNNSNNGEDIKNNTIANIGLLIIQENASEALYWGADILDVDVIEDLCQGLLVHECLMKDCQWVQGKCEEKPFFKTIKLPFPRPPPTTFSDWATLYVLLWDHHPSYGTAFFWYSFLVGSLAIIILLALTFLSLLGCLIFTCCQRCFCYTQNETRTTNRLNLLLPQTRKIPREDVVNFTEGQSQPTTTTQTTERRNYLVQNFIEATRSATVKGARLNVTTKKEDLETPTSWPFAPIPEEDGGQTINSIHTATISRCPRYATGSGTGNNGKVNCVKKASMGPSELIVSYRKEEGKDEGSDSIAKLDLTKTMSGNENNEHGSKETTQESNENVCVTENNNGSSNTVTENTENGSSNAVTENTENGSSNAVTENTENGSSNTVTENNDYSPMDASDSNKTNHQYEEIAHCSHTPLGNLNEIMRKRRAVKLQNFQAKLKKASPPQLPHNKQGMKRNYFEEEQESKL